MISKLEYTIYVLGLLIVAVNSRSSTYKELRPVLIKSVISHPKVPFNRIGSDPEDDRTSRKIYQFPGPGHITNNRDRDRDRGQAYSPPRDTAERPERGQILHRPKHSERRGHQSHQHSPSQSQMSNDYDAPVVLSGTGKGKKVKYVPTSGSDYQGNQPGNRPPQVYVISGGDDEDQDQGMMGSMQTYFKSMTGRIRAAMQGLIGGVTD